MKSVKGLLTQQNYTFELFGYDFLLDEDLNCVLIEVNTNPCLEEPNRLMKHLVPRMIDDMFNLTMDPLFKTGETKYKSTFPLPGEIFMVDQKEKPSPEQEHKGYPHEQNLFEHIYTFVE